MEKQPRPWRQLGFVLGEALLTLLSGGVLFIAVSRIGGPQLLGTYALAFAWLTLFQGLSSFGIPEFLVRQVGAHGRDAASETLHAIILGLGSGVAAICLMVGASRLAGYPEDVVRAIAVAAPAVIPGFLNTACRSVFLALRRMNLTFLVLLVEVTIATSASVFLLLSGYGVVALMTVLVFSKTISASISVSLLCLRVLPERPGFDFQIMKHTAQTVFTLGIGNMCGMLTTRIGTIMVSFWADFISVGHFAAATKILEISLIIPSVFNQLLLSRISHSFSIQQEKNPNRFVSWYELLFAIVIPLSVGIWVFAKPILAFLFGVGFTDAVWILRVLALYLPIETTGAIMSVILLAAQRQRQDVVRQAVNPLTNIALNLLFLPWLGAIGAAIGRVGGVVATTVLRQILIARELTAVNWARVVLKPIVISTAIGGVAMALLGLGIPPWVPLLLYGAATSALLILSSGFSIAVVKDMMSPRQI